MNLQHSCLFLLERQMELYEGLLLLHEVVLYRRLIYNVLQNWIATAKLYIQCELNDVHNKFLFTEHWVNLSFKSVNRDSSLPSRCKLDPCSSVMLRDVDLWLLTDVWEQLFCPDFKGQAVQTERRVVTKGWEQTISPDFKAQSSPNRMSGSYRRLGKPCRSSSPTRMPDSYLPTFGNNLSVQSSRFKQSKKIAWNR